LIVELCSISRGIVIINGYIAIKLQRKS